MSRLNISFDLDVRRRLNRVFYKRPILRNIVYGGIIFLGIYTLFYMTTTKETRGYFMGPKSRHPPLPANTWQEKAEYVKAAFVHAYHGYEQYAAPADELKPLSVEKIDNFNGWGVTAFDALDTMLLMDLKDEYQRGLKIVEKANFHNSSTGFVPYFETIIRYLGGLLSAYALSKDAILLKRAEDLTAALDPVFKSPSGLPYWGVYPANGRHKGGNTVSLAEIGTLQLEYSYLAKLTGKTQHFDRSETVMKYFRTANLSATGGMLPIEWDIYSGRALDHHLSVGARADSTHEYLLKLYLLTGKTDKASLELYIRATTQIITQLLYLSPERQLLYVTDTSTRIDKKNGIASHVFEHLSCFLPGLLALGAQQLPLDNLEKLGIKLENLGDEATYGHGGKAYSRLSSWNLKDLHMWAAEGLGQSCYLSYADMESGLGPDEMIMNTLAAEGRKFSPWGLWERSKRAFVPPPQTAAEGGEQRTYLWIDALEKWKESGSRGIVPGLKEKQPVLYSKEDKTKGTGKGRDYVLLRTGYLLRPETVESLYILWKVTGDRKWRDRGWKIFEAIERETKTKNGYASVQFVDISPAPRVDSMPSYFLAETLKYLYLLFLDKDPIDLSKWVFNTEAHPFPVFEWTAEEKTRFRL